MFNSLNQLRQIRILKRLETARSLSNDFEKYKNLTMNQMKKGSLFILDTDEGFKETSWPESKTI